MALISDKAERIVDAILSSNDKILLVFIRDWIGNILAVNTEILLENNFLEQVGW